MEEFVGLFFSFLFLKCFALAVAIALVSERLKNVATFTCANSIKNESVIDVDYEVVDTSIAPMTAPSRLKNATRRSPPRKAGKCNAEAAWAESLKILRSAA